MSTLTKTGTGTLTLSVCNSLPVVRLINGGIVNVGVNDVAANVTGPLGGGTRSVFGGGTLQYRARQHR